MTMPAPIASSVFADGELTTEVKWYTRVFSVINAIISWGSSVGSGFIGEVLSASTTTLTTAGSTYVVPSSVVTFTLATQRRVRIVAASKFVMASGTNGDYRCQAAYNVGTYNLAGVILTGYQGQSMATVATSEPVSASAEGTVLLAAGEYTAYPLLTRVAGGSATDTGTSTYLAVYDVGAS